MPRLDALRLQPVAGGLHDERGLGGDVRDGVEAELPGADPREIGRARLLLLQAREEDDDQTELALVKEGAAVLRMHLGALNAELAAAEAAFQARARAEALETGVTLPAPETVHFARDTVVGRDALIEPYVVFGPGVTVESGALIRSFSHLEGCHVSRGAVVGPYARLRPGAELSEDVRIGNFVEIKNALLAEGAKVNHLSYIGDAEIGEGSNIGAGTVTCNYDGVFKHRTTIGKGVFIGSDTMLVAPVTVGDGAMTGSGSVISRDVEPGALALARARQENKPGFATRFFARLRALKSQMGKGA